MNNSYVDHPFLAPTVLSLCPGFLGLERGVERAINRLRGGRSHHGHEGRSGEEVPALTVAAYVEIEAFICANLVAGMEAGLLAPAPIWSDLKTFPAHVFRGKVHGVLGGYPCQPFSAAGKQLGKDDPRHLWPFIRKHLHVLVNGGGLVWCFFENVANHLNLGYRQVRQELEDLGFHVEEGIFSAEEVGAPHRRERLFILAVANTESDRCVDWTDSSSGYNWQCHSNRFKRESLRGEPVGRGADVADTNDNTRRLAAEGRRDLSEIIGGGEVVADASRFARVESRAESTRQLGASGADVRGALVADAHGERGQLPAERHESTEQQPVSNSASRPAGQFPMGQGPDQYDWEARRTAEPGVGCTVNGYNFREDLLRAYGNSVVEQTAELAFLTLLRKQINFFELNEILG